MSERDNKGRLVCAWCGRDLGPSNTPEDSHGICEKCRRKMLEEDSVE